MTYVPYYSEWKNWPNISTPITAAAMQHIETGIVDAGSGGSGVVMQATTEISSAELLALDPTGVELLPALGGRNYYLIFFLAFHYRFATTPYNESIQFNFRIAYGAAGTSGDLFSPFGAGGVGDILQGTEDFYVPAPFANGLDSYINYGFAASVIENAPVVAGLSSGSITGGDGSLAVDVYYGTKDGAP